jgi:hypothetical protein
MATGRMGAMGRWGDGGGRAKDTLLKEGILFACRARPSRKNPAFRLINHFDNLS